MKKAASSENSAMSDDIAYNGTLLVSDTPHPYPQPCKYCVDLHDHDPNDSPLESGFTVILQLQRHRHYRYRRCYPVSSGVSSLERRGSAHRQP